MRNRRYAIASFVAPLFMLLLIFDAKTSFNGAMDGIKLCMTSVIPCLFPFFFLSGIINYVFTGRSYKPLQTIGNKLGIPSGFEHLLIIGMIGGYPVGAQSIHNAYHTGAIQKKDAERLLAFCNNAGPAFIFGMTSLMFSNRLVPGVLWLIQILCAFLTGFLLHKKTDYTCEIVSAEKLNISFVMTKAIHAITSVCGWVVIFRVLISFMDRWVFWLFGEEFKVMITGLLELSNGCIMLKCIHNECLRFMFAAVITVFGGICVHLQTASVCAEISCQKHFVGKLIQVIFCIPISAMASGMLFPGNNLLIYIGLVFSILIIFFLFNVEKFRKHTGNYLRYHV